MRRASIPVAIQHAPQYLGVTLPNATFLALRREFPGLMLLKGEGSALETADLIAETERAFAEFAGRGGLDMLTRHATFVGAWPRP